MRRLPRALRLSISVAVLLGLIVLVFLLVQALSGGRVKAVDEITEISATPTDQVLPFNDGYLVSNGVRAAYYDAKNKQVWEYMPDANERGMSASNAMVAFWWGDRISLLNKDGEILYTNSAGSPVDSVRCGLEQAAVHLPEQGSLLVLNSADGKEVQKIDLAGTTVLDYGFYSESDMLWVLQLDAGGAVPVTHLNTYQPSKKLLTGGYRFSDQIIYKVLFTTANTYVIGSRDIATISGGTIQTDTTLINGWQMLDSARTKDGWRMVFALAGEAVNEQPSRLKVVRENGTERELHLPSGCMAAVATDKRIYGIGTESVYALTLEGATTTYQLPFTIDGVRAKLTNNRIIVQVGEKLGILTLPS